MAFLLSSSVAALVQEADGVLTELTSLPIFAGCRRTGGDCLALSLACRGCVRVSVRVVERQSGNLVGWKKHDDDDGVNSAVIGTSPRVPGSTFGLTRLEANLPVGIPGKYDVESTR